MPIPFISKNDVDRAAVEAMRYMLNSVSMKGVVVIGEGEKDEAPMLFNGEELGRGDGPEVDIAVDPIDGTRLMACGLGGAISVVAAAERNSMFSPQDLFYLDKIVTGPEAADFIDIEAPVHVNLRRVAKAKNKAVEDVTVVMLDRPRNDAIREEVCKLGARIRLIPDGDVSGALTTCWNATTDLLLGSGGSPEAVITACAVKCLGGNMQCRPYFRNEEDEAKGKARGLTRHTVLTLDDLVKGDNVFFAATGASDGDMLKGVRYCNAPPTSPPPRLYPPGAHRHRAARIFFPDHRQVCLREQSRRMPKSPDRVSRSTSLFPAPSACWDVPEKYSRASAGP